MDGTFYLYYRSKIKIRGILTFHEMFVVLSKIKDSLVIQTPKNCLMRRTKKKKVCFIAIIMFLEATRFQSILDAIVARVQDCEDSSEFERKLSATS
jgi:hypothetical protein